MDRTLLGIVTALLAALVLVGLTFSRSVDPPADFRFINQTEPKTLDPQIMTGQPEGRLAEALFEGLTRKDARTMRSAPGVAESWDVSPDGKRYVFHLRANARWSDGHPVTAQDFVYSWKRLLDPKLASEYAYIIFPIRYAEALSTFDGHAEALETSVRKALSSLAAEHAEGVDAHEWQRFLAKAHVHDPLRHETDPKLLELLSRRDGRITASDLEWMKGALDAAAKRLREGAREARAHFGVDSGVVAVDDRTLAVELRAPTPYFLEVTFYFPLMPVPRWVTEDPKRRDDWFLPEHIVSNGPFVLKRWLVNDHIRLERSELYWGKSEVHSRAIDALSTETETTALNLYLTHEVDWDPQMYPTELAAELRRRPDFRTTPGLSVYYYQLNTTRPPLNDRRVRKAINLAVDRKLIVEQVLGLGQIPASTFVPPGIVGYDPPESPIRLDVTRARELLAEAGYPDGKGFPEVGILYNTMQAHKAIAEVIADQLRRNLGIKASAYNQEWQSYLDTRRTLDYDIARAAWVGDYADPNTFLDMWITNGGNNTTGFSSPLYDRLLQAAADVSTFIADPDPLLPALKRPADIRPVLESARHATEPEARLRSQAKLRMLLLREAEAILVQDEFPIMPLYFYVNGSLVAPEVRGFYSTLVFDDGTTAPNLQDIHPLRDIWVERGTSGQR